MVDEQDSRSPLPPLTGDGNSSSIEKGEEKLESKSDSLRCASMLEKALEDNTVKFMLERMENLGCAIPSNFVRCETCESESIIGHFDPLSQKKGVKLCEDVLEKFPVLGQRHVTRTVVHELVHAYDHCRAKVDWLNCYHHACSEIRAAHLSGDCYIQEEVSRGNFSLKGQGYACVRRRAELSLANNPKCAKVAQEAVNHVFDMCVKDTSPFIRAPP